jgi:Tol biopolymer transport system component
MNRFRSIFFSVILLLTSCTSPTTPIPLSSESNLFVFDLSSSSLIEYSTDFNIQRELPINLPCPLSATHPAPNQPRLALELACENGSLVQIMDTETGEVRTPITDVDSHFLAWDFEGNIYLRVDALGNAKLMRVALDGDSQQFDLPLQTYDMDFAPGGGTLVYSFTRGLGLGSELWAASSSGRRTWHLSTDQDAIFTFARWSPDGKQIAFIKMADTQTPFPMGELWVVEADGGNPRRLAPADAGHGYAAVWSTDSTRIAFVGRDNPDEAAADQSAGALISNIYMVNSATGQITQVTRFNEMLIEAPQWSADGHFLAFSVVTLNDTINVWIADLTSDAVTLLESPGATCCPSWIRK